MVLLIFCVFLYRTEAWNQGSLVPEGLGRALIFSGNTVVVSSIIEDDFLGFSPVNRAAYRSSLLVVSSWKKKSFESFI